MRKEVLRLERVTYRHDNTTILNNFSMSMMKGEIMGLQPLETYGLDELLYVLTENPPLYFGYVYYMEQCVNSWQDSRRGRNRISIIGMRSSLVGDLSILTNIFVLRPGFGQKIIHDKVLIQQLQPFLDDLQVTLDPDLPVERLSPYERVLVELLRAVVAGHHLIVIREISSIISEEELKDLHRIIRHYADQGFSFLYISMHFEEIGQICSSAAIYHDARIDMVMEEVSNEKKLPRSYYQDYYNHVSSRFRHHKPGQEKREVLLDDLFGEAAGGFALSVYEGECLVIQNMEAKTYDTLVKRLTEDRAGGESEPGHGKMTLEGIRNRKIAVLREEPGRTMVFEDLSVLDNLCFTLDHRIPFIWTHRRVRDSVREEYIRMFGTDICKMRTSELSRTDRLKLVYTRILLQKPDVAVLLQPFKGADVDERYQIFLLQEMLLQKGIAIVILAVSMGDSLSIADRVIRVAPGKNGLDIREYRYEDFSKLPVYLPWVDVIDETQVMDNWQKEKENLEEGHGVR